MLNRSSFEPEQHGNRQLPEDVNGFLVPFTHILQRSYAEETQNDVLVKFKITHAWQMKFFIKFSTMWS